MSMSMRMFEPASRPLREGERPFSQFVQMYLDSILELVGNADPYHPGRRIDWRNDAGETAFLERQLELIEAQTYAYRLRDLKYRMLFPINNEGQGAREIGYDMYRGTGVAKIIASGSDDLPRADVFVTRELARVRTLGIFIDYTTQELRHAIFARVPLDAMRGAAARRGMDEALNSIAWFGDTNYNLQGLLSNPNVPQVEANAPASGSNRTWKGGDKTPAEVIKDISDARSRIIALSKQTHFPDTLLVPQEQFDYLITTPISSSFPNRSIMSWITDPDNRFGFTLIEPCIELKGSGPGGSDEMVLFERSPDVLTFRIPLELRPLPPEVRNLSYKINMEAECAGMTIRYPLAISRVHGI